MTSEVLPQIRQTGGYIPTKDAQGRQLSNEEIINRADAIVCRTLCMLNEDAEDTLTATQVAKTFNPLCAKVRKNLQIMLFLHIISRRLSKK